MVIRMINCSPHSWFPAPPCTLGTCPGRRGAERRDELLDQIDHDQHGNHHDRHVHDADLFHAACWSLKPPSHRHSPAAVQLRVWWRHDHHSDQHDHDYDDCDQDYDQDDHDVCNNNDNDCTAPGVTIRVKILWSDHCECLSNTFIPRESTTFYPIAC